MVRHASLPIGLKSSAGRSCPAPIAAVTSTMPYVRCIRCGVRCFSAARWSNVDQCGVCGGDLPRRPVDSRAAFLRLRASAGTVSRVLVATVPDAHEGAVMTSGGVGPRDPTSPRRVAARPGRSA